MNDSLLISQNFISSKSTPYLSIVIPVYNESYCILNTLNSIIEYFRTYNFTYEIIIVNDGSTDETNKIIAYHFFSFDNIRLINLNKNYGKGYAVKNGILNSNGEIILMTDADLSVPISEFNNLYYQYLNYNYDIVIGSRALKESKILVRQSLVRQTMGKIFNFLVRYTTKLPYKDTQCGFKLFRKSIAIDLFKRLSVHGFSFDVEILLIAKKLGYKIKETPVKWINSPKSSVKIIHHSFTMLYELYRILKKNK